MGCSTLDITGIRDAVDVRDWVLDAPDGRDLDEVRRIRDDVEQRVTGLFDEIATDTGE